MDGKQGKYEIYGRTTYEQPLSFVAELVAEGDVKAEALAQVGDDGWVELVAIPTASFLHVIGEKEDD